MLRRVDSQDSIETCHVQHRAGRRGVAVSRCGAGSPRANRQQGLALGLQYSSQLVQVLWGEMNGSFDCRTDESSGLTQCVCRHPCLQHLLDKPCQSHRIQCPLPGRVTALRAGSSAVLGQYLLYRAFRPVALRPCLSTGVPLSCESLSLHSRAGNATSEKQIMLSSGKDLPVPSRYRKLSL